MTVGKFNTQRYQKNQPKNYHQRPIINIFMLLQNDSIYDKARRNSPHNAKNNIAISMVTF